MQSSHTTRTTPMRREKLQKILAGAGLGSRRALERWIANGQVTVNGQQAQLGDRASLTDAIAVNGQPVKLKAYATSKRRVIAYNKPEGEICSRTDPQGRPTVFDRLPTIRGERWLTVGRLDLNTAGLLLFTNDGQLANQLMHPAQAIEREYAVRVMGEVTPAKVKRLFDGVVLADGPARFTDIVDSGGSGINRWFHVCILEGRNREVRRLWESQHVTVSRLKRVRFGNVIIPDRLRVGHWQELAQTQVEELAALAGLLPTSNRSNSSHVHPRDKTATRPLSKSAKKPQHRR